MDSSLLLDEDAWLDCAAVAALLEDVASRLGDPLLGRRLAKETEIPGLGEWGALVAGARTLAQAFDVAMTQLPRVHTGVSLSLSREGADAVVTLEFADDFLIGMRQYVEATLMMVRRVLDLAGQPVQAIVCLPYDGVRVDGVECGSDTRLALRSRSARLVFHSDSLRLPLRIGAAGRSSTNVAPSTHAVALGTMRVLRDLILFERPTAQAVASAMAMSVRSLQRHLSDWGINFREILDQHRRRMAQLYLEAGSTVTDAAFRLGYSDTAHFIRAFRRWTGHSPGQVCVRGGALPLQVFKQPVRPIAADRAAVQCT